MKKFARCVLILVLVTVLSGVIGYAVLNSKIQNMYTSTTQLYVVTGEKTENAVRTSSGSLNEDFEIVIKSSYVISDAQKTAGTSENIGNYITVKFPANSNIVEITCTNPDQNTAKSYADAVAKSTLKVTNVIPVEKVSILTEGTSTGIAQKPHLYEYTAYIAGLGFGICLVLELLVVLFISAFKKPEDEDDNDYDKFYGNISMQALMPLMQTQVQHEIQEQTEKEEYEPMVQQSHPIEADVLENEDDDDTYGEDILDSEDLTQNEEELETQNSQDDVEDALQGFLQETVRAAFAETVKESATEEMQRAVQGSLNNDEKPSREKSVVVEEAAVTQERSSTEVLGRLPV